MALPAPLAEPASAVAAQATTAAPSLAETVIIPHLPLLLTGGLIVGGLAVLGWILNTWLRVKHGYPLETSWGTPLHRSGPTASDRQLAAMAEELRHLRTELGELKTRTAVLERLATDPMARLDREIAGLSGTVN
jgi:hypothetical protein